MLVFENGNKIYIKTTTKQRNFKLSGIELLILIFILLGIAHLIIMWTGSYFSSKPETITVSDLMIEKTLIASEKALSQLSCLNDALIDLRKDFDELRSHRTSIINEQPISLFEGMEYRLKELEKQIKIIINKEIIRISDRLERLEQTVKYKEK